MKLNEIKNILFESAIKTYPDDIEAAKFILKKCSEWPNFETPLWRLVGYDFLPAKSFDDKDSASLFSTKDRKRSSTTSKEIQEFIFSQPSFKDFPNRQSSIFCSTTQTTLVQMPVLLAVYPVNGIKFAQVNNKDFNVISLTGKLKGITLPVFSYILDDFGRALVMLKGIKPQTQTLSFIEKIKLAKTAFNKDPVDEIWEEKLSNLMGKSFTNKHKAVLNFIKSDNIENYLTPDKLGLSIVSANGIKNLGTKQTEVWFEGDYVVIREGKDQRWSKVLKEIKKLQNEIK